MTTFSTSRELAAAPATVFGAIKVLHALLNGGGQPASLTTSIFLSFRQVANGCSP